MTIIPKWESLDKTHPTPCHLSPFVLISQCLISSFKMSLWIRKKGTVSPMNPRILKKSKGLKRMKRGERVEDLPPLESGAFCPSPAELESPGWEHSLHPYREIRKYQGGLWRRAWEKFIFYSNFLSPQPGAPSVCPTDSLLVVPIHQPTSHALPVCLW